MPISKCVTRNHETDSLRCLGCGEEYEIPRRVIASPADMLEMMDALNVEHKTRGCEALMDARKAVKRRCSGAA